MAQHSVETGDETENAATAKTGVLTPRIPQDIGIRSQRQRILEAMAKSCAEKTFSRTTIADIVEHAGISRGTFYKHFASKEECVHAAAEAFLLELQGVGAIAYTRSGDLPVDSVRDVIAAVLERLAAKPEYTRLLLVEAPIVDPEIVRRYRHSVIGALKKMLQTGSNVARAKADPEIAFGRAKVVIVDYVAAGKIKDLPSLLPELVYIALLPYAGQAAALAQAKKVR